MPRSVRWSALPSLALVLLLGACASDPGGEDDKKPSTLFERLQGTENRAREEERTAERQREKERVRDDRPDVLPFYERTRPGGPRAVIRVTWEALARERELYESSRFTRPQGAVDPDMLVTLISAGHPDAERVQNPRTREERERFARVAVVPDADLVALVQSLRKEGFDRYAQPTDMQEGQWSNSAARGRVTVEEGGSSVSLLSMRGQGLNPATKAIPALYSGAKRAIMLLRNRNATLSISSVERGDAPFLPAGR